MPIRSRMSSITGQIEPEYPELFALEFGKYVIARSRKSMIMNLIGPELSELSALE